MKASAPNVPGSNAPRFAWWCLGLATAATVAVVAKLLYLSRSGIDFTDEGYYINWIAHRELYPVSPTQFGFVYGPLYDLVGQNLVLLRAANLVLTLGCGWFFFGQLILDQRRPVGAERLAWLALAFVLSLSSLTVLYLWLPTPSYNTLALQGLLLGGGAIGLIRRDAAENRTRGYLLLGAAGVLTFLAKPTTAAAAAPLFLVCLAVRRQLTWRGLLLMALTSLVGMVAAALAIDASLTRFYLRLAKAAADTQLLQSSYSFWATVRVDSFDLTRPQHHALWYGAAFLGITSWLAASSRRGLGLVSCGLVLASLSALLAIFGFYFFHRPSLLNLYGYELGPLFSYSSGGEWIRRFPNSGVLLLAWPVGAFAACLVRFSRRPAWSEMTVALCLLLMPYAYVVGTNVNYWQAMGGAAVFWCAAGLVCLGPSTLVAPSWPQFLPLAAGAFAGTVLLLVPAIEAPYRQRQPLHMNGARIAGMEGGFLRVPDDNAHYIQSVKELLDRHGFEPGEPMIDLTGRFPTLLYLVKAKPVALAWMLGGYPGSEAFVRQGLDRAPPESLRRAWVLSEPGGPRALSPALLEPYDLDLARDYEEIGTVNSPLAEHSRSFKQHLYKPVSAGKDTDR